MDLFDDKYILLDWLLDKIQRKASGHQAITKKMGATGFEPVTSTV